VALVETLTDTFATQDTTKWSGWGTDVAVSSGRLAINATSAYPQLTSVSTYDLTGSRLAWQMTAPTPIGNTRQERGGLRANGDATNILRFTIYGGTLYAEKLVNTTADSIIGAGVDYNAATMAWFRIREASGTTFFEYGADGTTWTAFQSTPTPAWATTAQVFLTAGYWGTETAATAFYDNVNVAPGGGTGSGTAVLTATGTLAVAGSPRRTGAGAFTGAGTLAVATSGGGGGGSTPLRLRGGTPYTLRRRTTLRAGATGVAGGSVSLSATGTLAVTGLPATRAVILSASGTLAVVGPPPASSGTAAFTATGTLTTVRIGGPMTITVTTFPRAGMARVSIDFTGSATAATATLVASLDDGTSYVVRGGGPVTLSGKVGVVDDFEVPLDIGVIYTATANGGDILSTGTITIGASEAFGQPTSWLKDPAVPARNVPVQLSGGLELSYPARMGVFDVIGKSNAVAVAGVRGAIRTRITLATLNPASIDDVRGILLSGNVLLLQTPAGYKLGNLYVAVNDVTEVYPTRILRLSARYWQLDVVQVDRPVGAYVAALNTWAVATATYGTWATMAAQTWLTVMQGADPNATGADTFVDPVYGGTVL
jgi:hypothetical protein